MNKTKEYTITPEEAYEFVNSIEYISTCIFAIILLIAIILKVAIIPDLPSYFIFIIIGLYYIPLFIWESWYDKKYHFMSYFYKKRRIENGITACPYCGNKDLNDTNEGTICKQCNKALPTYYR